MVKKSDVNPSGKSWQVVTELQTGVAYKLGLFQAGITKNLYFKGAMSGYYFATVEEAALSAFNDQTTFSIVGNSKSSTTAAFTFIFDKIISAFC